MNKNSNIDGNKISDLPNAQLNISNAGRGKLKPIFTASPPNFGMKSIGRKKLIKNGISMLKNEKLLVLMGMGGIGKTKIAKEIYYNAKGYKYKGWVNYSAKQGLISSIVDAMEFSCGLNFPDKISVEEKFSIIEKELNNTWGNVLFVVDNINEQITEENEIDRLLGLGCDVLITSRFNLTNDSRTMDVGLLNEKDSLKLFYSNYTIEKNDKKAKEIIKLAGFHTMTIEMLSKMAETARMDLIDFSEKLKEQSFDVLGVMEKVKTESDIDALENELSKHLTKLFDIDNLSDDEKTTLLHVLIISKYPISKSDVKEILGLKGYFELNNLISKGWLMQSEEDVPVVQMHALIWNSVQKKYDIEPDGDVLKMVGKVAKKLEWNENGFFGDVIGYLPLAIDIYERFEENNEIEMGSLLNNIAIVYGDMHYYNKALTYSEKSLEIAKNTDSKDDTATPLTINNMARIYCEMGDYENAINYYDLAIESGEKVFDKTHAFIMESYKALAWVYILKKQYEKAEKAYEKVLPLYIEKYGQEHSETIDILNNISGVYNMLGLYDKALDAMGKVLDYTKSTHGDNNLETASAYNNIANVYAAKKDYSKALENYDKALIIRKKVLGDNHPASAKTNYNIALIYSEKKEYFIALEHFERALEAQKKCLSENHSDTGKTYYSIGDVYQNKLDFESAIEYFLKSYKSFRESDGSSSNAVYRSLNEIKKAYLASGRPEEEFDSWLEEQVK